MQDRIHPVELRAPQGARELEIDWSDDRSHRFSHLLLRAFCPCANCQGHQGAIRWAEGAEEANLEITEIQPVGNYALRLTWGDGHNTGIYSFRHFLQLAPLEGRPHEELKAVQLPK